MEREFGETVAVRDALARLVAAGLAHRIEGGFVFVSAAGRYALTLEREDR